jgi:hypothetical protein
LANCLEIKDFTAKLNLVECLVPNTALPYKLKAIAPSTKQVRSPFTLLSRNSIMPYTTYTQQAIPSSSVDEQATAQAELYSHLETQAEAVALEHLTTVEISFYDHEYYLGGKLVAAITYDNDLTQPWVVMVNAKEKHRANTWAKCNSYITWHHKQGTLEAPLATPQPEELTILEISYYDQEVHIGDYLVDSYLVASISFDHENYQDLYWRVLVNGNEIYRDTKPTLCYEYIKQQYKQGTLPIQEQLPLDIPCTIGNKIMSQVFAECEKFGFEILDDGIYHNDVKLGDVGCTDNGWWVMRTAEKQKRILCNSALDAVWWLSKAEMLRTPEAITVEELLDKEFDSLTFEDWESLKRYVPETRDLVAA